MRKQIEAKIEAWGAEVDRLQQRRQQLAAELAETDASIQRHLGAIAGARELLELAQDNDAAQAAQEA